MNQEQLIQSLAYNTASGSMFVYLKSSPYKKTALKAFLNFKNEKVYFVAKGSEKLIFKNEEDLAKINNFIKN